ncbi:uncharacterized protein TNCV_853941 [Trichonephila clavipes]|nr:uncharacterized protein TNCV_853941 [Trichonephila clavipes]
MIFISGTACFWDIDPSEYCPDPNDPQCKHLFNKGMNPSFPEKEHDMPSFCSLKTYEMECYGRQTMDACGTESHTTYKEISMRSSYYSADCKDYQHYFKSLEAMVFVGQHLTLQTLKYPGESLPSKLM